MTNTNLPTVTRHYVPGDTYDLICDEPQDGSTPIELYRVFVYGSLLTGLHNNVVLQEAGGVCDGEFTTTGFAMYDLGSFPACVADEDSATDVQGEVWLVDAAGLRALDRLEGYQGPGAPGSFYDRITVTLDDGSEALMYVLTGHGHRPHNHRVYSCDWRAHYQDKWAPAADADAGDSWHECPDCDGEGYHESTDELCATCNAEGGWYVDADGEPIEEAV